MLVSAGSGLAVTKTTSNSTEISTLFSLPHTGEIQRDEIRIDGKLLTRWIGEFWTAKQRQGSSLHEVSYRACFKPQLPEFFIRRLTSPGDLVYDPFSGRGTTAIEAALLGRRVAANDTNPLSEILCHPRLELPDIARVEKRLQEIPRQTSLKAEQDLSMFYHPDTLAELLSLRTYLAQRRKENKEDAVDRWIRMVATNRLTGHSSGFFSVYTLPPNQAVSPTSQLRINRLRRQTPEYRDTHRLILKKSRSLQHSLTPQQRVNLHRAATDAHFLSRDARYTPELTDSSVKLTVTSPPFLNIVQYSKDNWLRCWFNGLDDRAIARQITISSSVEEWGAVMAKVFRELFRITQRGGWVAFEVGEVRKKTIRLDESVVPLGLATGFTCVGILINTQHFTKTANIWGVSNNRGGTNTNRIVIFRKE